jgi:hypothetical protein
VRERNRGLDGIADDVGQASVASQPRVELLDSTGMDEDEAAELFRLRPEGMKFRIRQLLAVDAAADRRAAQAELPDAFLELLRRKVRILQRD